MTNPPLLSPEFRINGTILEYKSTSDGAWIPMWDVSGLIPVVPAKNRRVTMFHDEANVSGGTLTLNINTANINNYTAFSTAQGFNAYQTFDCDLMPACKIRFIGTKANNHGIMGVYLDGVFITSLDWYNSTTLLNQIQSVSFAASAISAGRHTLRLEVVSKHASSSGYALTLTKYWLAPDSE